MKKQSDYTMDSQQVGRWKSLLATILENLLLQCFEISMVSNGWWNITQNIMNNKYLIISIIAWILSLTTWISVYWMNSGKTSVAMEEFIQKSCKEWPYAIYKCGNYYSFESRINTMLDVGPTIYDKNMQIKGSCNGMDRNPQKYCQNKNCEATSLCQEIEIDCSNLTEDSTSNWNQNRCYTENAIRQKDLNHCKKAKSQESIDSCYSYYAISRIDIDACNKVQTSSIKKRCEQYLNPILWK